MESELYISQKNAELIDTDDFIKFIYQFKKPIICPICDTSSWSVQGIMDVDVVDGEPFHKVIESINFAKYDVKEDRVNAYPGGLPVLRITCNTCAYMMFFSYKKVRSIINAQKIKQEKKA